MGGIQLMNERTKAGRVVGPMTERMPEALRRLVEAVERLGWHRQCPICRYIDHRPDCALEQARAALGAASQADVQARAARMRRTIVDRLDADKRHEDLLLEIDREAAE